MTGMTISQAAARAGVSVETIRFYQRKGLIETPPRPRHGGYRDYSEDIVRRVRFIRNAQALGFSLREAGELLSLRLDPRKDCADVRAHARAKQAEIDCKIEGLKRMKAALDQLIDTCPGKGPLPDCPILDALESGADSSLPDALPDALPDGFEAR